MDYTVQLETLSPDCLEYACCDSISYVVRESMISLIDVYQVFSEI